MVYFEKSQPAPASLLNEKEKTSGICNTEEVLIRLKEDFKNKCYLCEQKEITDPQVEHLLSHREDKNLKFNWDNLFLSCSHCNNIKGTKYDNILNCTKESDRVETRLKYICEPFPAEKVDIEVIDNSEKTNLTKELLLAIYFGNTPTQKLGSANLRKKLLDEIEKFDELLSYYRKSNTQQQAIKSYLFTEVSRHLSRSSNFAAFKRWKMRNYAEITEFEQYFD